MDTDKRPLLSTSSPHSNPFPRSTNLDHPERHRLSTSSFSGHHNNDSHPPPIPSHPLTMPIDADAYMAGHIPTLSRGGSWRPSSHPIASAAQMTNPVPGASSPPTVQSYGITSPLFPIHLTPQRSFALRTRASTGHPGWHAPTLTQSTNSDPPISVNGGSVSPPKLPRLTPSLTPVSPPMSSARMFHYGRGYWPGDFWEKQAGAPKPLEPEADYHSVNQRTVHRPRAESLPDPAPTPVPLDRARTKSVSTKPPSTASSYYKPTVKPTTRRESPPEPTRPSLSRRHTHEPLQSSPPTPSNNAARTRHLSNPEKASVPPPGSTMDFMAGSNTDEDDGLTSSAIARDAPQGYISPLSTEGYDRYTAHPAAAVPPRYDRPSTLLSPGSGAPLQQVYIPPGYPKGVRNMPPVDREGPLMRTYGVPWTSEAIPLSPEPEGPRWIIARPPRLNQMEGGTWWQSGGQGE